MKKVILLLVLAGVMPLTSMAQDDDLYFVPKKAAETRGSSQDKVVENPTYYAGSDRDVDEYNRHGKYWSHYQKIGSDSVGNDIISFQKGRGVYPDSTYVDTTFVGKYFDTVMDEDEYEYSRRMSRWDGFYDPWFYSWRWGWGPYRYGWYDPWYSPFYAGYYGWWDPWYDPWFYGGWYSPWYYSGWYGYYGWGGYPYWGGYYPYHGGLYAGGSRMAGSRTWSSPMIYNRQTGTYTARTGNGGRRTSTYRSASNRRFGSSTRNNAPATRDYGSRSFGSTRSTGTVNSGGSYSSGSGFGGSHSGSFGGGSFGGSRSGGSFGGGGGRFGGHR